MPAEDYIPYTRLVSNAGGRSEHNGNVRAMISDRDAPGGPAQPAPAAQAHCTTKSRPNGAQREDLPDEQSKDNVPPHPSAPSINPESYALPDLKPLCANTSSR